MRPKPALLISVSTALSTLVKVSQNTSLGLMSNDVLLDFRDLAPTSVAVLYGQFPTAQATAKLTLPTVRTESGFSRRRRSRSRLPL